MRVCLGFIQHVGGSLKCFECFIYLIPDSLVPVLPLTHRVRCYFVQSQDWTGVLLRTGAYSAARPSVSLWTRWFRWGGTASVSDPQQWPSGRSINLQQQRTAPRSDWRLDRCPTGDSPPNEFLINTAEPSDHKSTSNACVLWSGDVLDVKSELFGDSLKVSFFFFLLLMCVKSDNKHTNKQSGHFGNKPRKFTKLRINNKKKCWWFKRFKWFSGNQIQNRKYDFSFTDGQF